MVLSGPKGVNLPYLVPLPHTMTVKLIPRSTVRPEGSLNMLGVSKLPVKGGTASLANLLSTSLPPPHSNRHTISP